MAYERIEIVHDDPSLRPPGPPPASLFAIPAPPGPGEPYPLAIPGNPGAASPFAPLGIAADAPAYDEGFAVVLIRPGELVQLGAAAASELPQGELGFLSGDGSLEIPSWEVVFVPEGAETSADLAGAADSAGAADPSAAAIDQLQHELGRSSAGLDLDGGVLSLPVEAASGLGQPQRAPSIAAVIDGTPRCDACGDPGSSSPDVGSEPLPDCEAAGWLSVAVSGAVLSGSNEGLVSAQIDRAEEVYDQCCIQVDVTALEVWDEDQTAALLGDNLYLDELSIFQDQFGFFDLSDEQLALLARGVTPRSGAPVPVWWLRRTRSSEVGYVMRADGEDERAVVLSGGLPPDYEANNIVLAHELGHVLLEGQLEGDHHDYMHPRNLMASGRINTGFGELTAAQCRWMRGSPYLR